MSHRQDFLERLRTDFECPEPWEAMAGPDGCRFCGSCQKNVFDFERMTPREIRARLESGGGRVCARLTRDGGVLRTLAEAVPEPRRRKERGFFGGRPSPIAASLLGAWLGVGAAAAQPPSPPAADASALAGDRQGKAERPSRGESRAAGAAVLSGRVMDHDGRSLPGATVVAREVPGGRERRVLSGADGTFIFEKLPAGVYDLQAELPDFEGSPVFNLLLEAGHSRETELRARPIGQAIATLGLIALPAPGLHELYDESELVVAAMVENSEILSIEGRQAEVATRLIIERRIKGTVKERRVTYRHSEYLEAAAAAGEQPGRYQPGDEVLGFLVAAPDGEGAAAGLTFETADFVRGLRRLEGGEREAYLERLEDLARLERGARRRGSYDSAALMEWLVETAENPLTRGEAIGEIAQALEALKSLAMQEGLEPAELARRLQEALEEAAGSGESESGLAAGRRAVFLGAAFSEQHRQRLIAALLAAHSLSDADRRLFDLVRDWHPGLVEGG